MESMPQTKRKRMCENIEEAAPPPSKAAKGSSHEPAAEIYTTGLPGCGLVGMPQTKSMPAPKPPNDAKKTASASSSVPSTVSPNIADDLNTMAAAEEREKASAADVQRLRQRVQLHRLRAASITAQMKKAMAAEQKHKAAKNEAAERCKESMRAFRHIAANSSSPGEVFAAEVAAELLSTKTNRESSNDLD